MISLIHPEDKKGSNTENLVADLQNLTCLSFLRKLTHAHLGFYELSLSVCTSFLSFVLSSTTELRLMTVFPEPGSVDGVLFFLNAVTKDSLVSLYNIVGNLEITVLVN